MDAYHQIAAEAGPVKLAGGEGAHTFFMAQHMIDYAGIGYVQIDAGRIGGITIAKRVYDYAQARGVTFVNHTFTSHLALCASMQAFAGQPPLDPDGFVLCEYPTELKPMAWEAWWLVHATVAMVIFPLAWALLVVPDLWGVISRQRLSAAVPGRGDGRPLIRSRAVGEEGAGVGGEAAGAGGVGGGASSV